MAGQPATLFVQPSRSGPLAGASGALSTCLGFNNWALGKQELPLRPAPQLEGAPAVDAGAAGAAGQEARWQSASFVVPPGSFTDVDPGDVLPPISRH